jgi:hypothetical protein
MLLTYTGIGSTSTPKKIQQKMTSIATILEAMGFTLLSGDAPGADSAFSRGCTNKLIFLPWKGFNDSKSPLYIHNAKAEEIASRFHPIWERLTQGQRKFHIRNVKQVLGKECDTPSKFLICWTNDGVETGKTSQATGGSGQAIRIAQHYKVPIFNLQKPGRYEDFIKYLKTNYAS